MKKKWINFLLFGFISFYCSAQTEGYKFYAPLDTVKISSFYNIEITPELSAHIKTDYSDLRVINNNNRWVPHILRNPAKEITDGALIRKLNFIISENTNIQTTLIIENKQGLISDIGLIIRNTAAKRSSVLSGSDDNKNWFIINDSIILNPVPAEMGSENLFTINFPPSNYKFFKLLIHNNNKDAFDITGVIQHITATSMLHAQNRTVQNPATTIEQKDSGKISYIKTIQQHPYHFDFISLKINGAKFFNRKAELYISQEEGHSFAKPGRLLTSFTISNKSPLNFQLPLTKGLAFYILINNEDNLPLTVNEVNTSLLTRYITTYLEKDSSYKLIIDNEEAAVPEYDFPQLSNNYLIDSIPDLMFGKIIAFPETVIPVKTEKKNNWLLWSSIAAVLLILLFFTYKMLKEVDKRKTT